MKAIKTCAPLLLILAIGCDDQNESIELDNDTNNARWTPEEGPLKLEENDAAARAAHVIKAHRAITQLMNHDVLNPFADQSDTDDRVPYCTIEKSTVLVTQQSACANFPGQGYEIDVTDCDMGGGDTYSGTIFVSTDFLHHTGTLLPSIEDNPEAFTELMELNKEWVVDVQLESESGTNVAACGVSTSSPRAESSSVIMHVTNPEETDAGGNPLNATYEANSTQNQRGFKFSNTRSELNLVGAQKPEVELEHIRVRGVYRSDQLTPEYGSANYRGSNMGSIRFNSRLHTEDMMIVESPFRSSVLVEVPAL